MNTATTLHSIKRRDATDDRLNPSSRPSRANLQRLYSELYQIAGGSPCKGPSTLYRVRSICQALYEAAPTLHLLENLRGLQDLMALWTSEEARELSGNGLLILREQLMDCIDEISGQLVAIQKAA